MSEIKDKLKDLITDGMIPEVEAYLEELLAIKEMESFLVELQNVLAVIEEDKTEDSEYQRIYNYITENLESEEH